MTDTVHLDQARGLREGLPSGVGYRNRACALLARMALESAVTHRVVTAHPELARASMRSRLLCLPLKAPEDVVQAAAAAWAGLSRACHHHPYELAPTLGEIDHWLSVVEHVVAALDDEGVVGSTSR